MLSRGRSRGNPNCDARHSFLHSRDPAKMLPTGLPVYFSSFQRVSRISILDGEVLANGQARGGWLCNVGKAGKQGNYRWFPCCFLIESLDMPLIARPAKPAPVPVASVDRVTLTSDLF